MTPEEKSAISGFQEKKNQSIAFLYMNIGRFPITQWVIGTVVHMQAVFLDFGELNTLKESIEFGGRCALGLWKISGKMEVDDTGGTQVLVLSIELKEPEM